VGGTQLPLMAKFFRALPWHLLEPDASAITWDTTASGYPPDAKKTQRPYQKATADRSVIVAYLPQANGNPHSPEGPPGTPAIGCRPPLQPQGNTSSCVGCYSAVIKLHNTTAAGRSSRTRSAQQAAQEGQTVSWFNPRTGKTTAVGEIPAGATEFHVPSARPGGVQESFLDWVLLVKPKPKKGAAAADVPGALVRPKHEEILVEMEDGGDGDEPHSSFSSDGSDSSDLTTAAVGSFSSGSGGKSWVSSAVVKAGGRERQGSGPVGCEFTATQPMTVVSLCRWLTPSSNNIVPVSIFSATGAAETGFFLVQNLLGVCPQPV
jgi:hypothetical protein